MKKEIQWKYKIGDILGNIEIIDRKIKYEWRTSNKCKNGGYYAANKYYQYKCLKCGFDGAKECYKKGIKLDNHWVLESVLVGGSQCACCHGTVVQTGINDVATTDPDVVKYFLDKKLSKIYSRSATIKISIQCPICGFVNPNKTTIYNLVWQGISCFQCGDAISYPEKLMYFVLKQANVQFEFHKVFNWSKQIFNKYSNKYGNKEYDFYLPDYNLIIELHGKQHYQDGTPFSVYGERGRTLTEEQENDYLKRTLALQNNCKYIVVDCKNSNLSYVKNSILNSELKNYINISDIQWDECHKSALLGIKMLVINDKINNPNMTSSTLAQKYNVSQPTIITWLKQGAQLCGYDPKEEIKKSSLYANHARHVYSLELDMAFDSIKHAADYVGIAPSNISACLAQKKKHAGKHPITKTSLTWQYITKSQYEELIKRNAQNLLDNTKLIC